MGVGAARLAGISFDQYNVTFGQYLNAALHDAGDCALNTIPLNASSAMYAGFREGTLDFSFVDPGTFACLTVSCAYFCALQHQQNLVVTKSVEICICRVSLGHHHLLR